MSDVAPQVSVILPVRNEGKEFRESLQTVLGQDYPADRLEVLVADGMSDDETRRIVRELAAEDPRLRLIDNPGRIVPTAMNLAIREARGEFIVRIDGHTRIGPDYVRSCVSAWRGSRAECVGGGMTPRGDTFVGRLVETATSGPFGVGNSHFHYSAEPRYTDTVYMGAWPRRVLLELGGFDEEMVRDQDDELNYRLRSRGGKVWLDPAIRSIYRPRGSLRRLWSQYRQYGFWKVRVFQKHPSMMRLRHFAPALFVLAGAVLALAALVWAPARPAFLASLLLYALAGWVAAARTPGRSSALWPMPLVYFIIHAGYGVGFLQGLLRFLPLWFDRKRARRMTSTLLSDSSPGEHR